MVIPKQVLQTLPRPILIGLLPIGAVMATMLVLASAVWWGLRAPAETLLVERQAAFQTAKEKQARLQRLRIQQAQTKAAQAQLQEQLKHLPAQDQFSTLSVTISEMGQAERVSIPGMTYSLHKKEPGVPVKATMAFKVTGDYASIYRFIRRLEQTDPYVVIESLDAAREDRARGEGGAQVVCNMKVVTFLRTNDDMEQGT